MTDSLRGIILLAVAFFVARLLGRRRIYADSISQKIAPARPDATPVRGNPKPGAPRAKQTTPVSISATQRVTPDDYLLGGRSIAGRPDRTAAIMDMMSGPGVCTPRDL